MAKATKRDEEVVLEKFRSLSAKRKQEVIDLLDLLASGEKAKNWLELDEWAFNLAKERGFDRLTEDDVARIVSNLRSGD
ncbi:MAG TPA: hypothetical protein VGL70_23995 [Candidatus Binatia bacterium]